jgi:hypothetical protein
MKKTIILALLIPVLLSIAVSQVRKNPKLPNDAGLGCVDVSRKLNSNVENGQMTVAQCCQGIKLVADVKEENTREGIKRKIVGWHVFNAEGKELEAEIGEVRRENASGVKSNEGLNVKETVVVVREPKACFIVDRKENSRR